MPMLLALLMFLGGAYYFTNPDERARFFGAVLRVFRQVMDAASHLRAERGPFGDALRARTPLAVVTPVLVGLNVVVFVLMLFGAGALSDPQTVVGWGGSVGPRTTNGEWWRLVTAMFVHSGPLHLIANILGLVQIGLIVERLLGRFAFATVYLSAGLISGLVSLSLHPVNVSGGASASILGIYGLFVAVVIAGHVFHSPLTIPPMAVLKAPQSWPALAWDSSTGSCLRRMSERTHRRRCVSERQSGLCWSSHSPRPFPCADLPTFVPKWPASPRSSIRRPAHTTPPCGGSRGARSRSPN
jgi:membrane associated rhomboid family serine protease